MIRRRWKLSLVLAAVVVLGVGPYLASRLQSPGRRVRVRVHNDATTAPAAQTLRIAAYNIAHGRGATSDNWEESGEPKRRRTQQIAKLLDEADADVVVLNEVDISSTWSGHHNQAEAIARLAGYPHWVEQRNVDFRFLYGSWKFGNAILSRYPIVEAQPVEFPPYSNWEDWLAGRKRAVVCMLQLSPTQQVRVLAVHLEHRSEDVRLGSARMIARLASASQVPLIAAGDFNTAPSGFPGAGRTASGQNAMDALVRSGRFRMRPESPPGLEGMTFSSQQPNQVIDWILIPSGGEFQDYRVDHSRLSDHRLVVGRVVLGPEK